MTGCAFIVGCSAGATPGVRFTPEQRHTADQIISIFENNTPEIQYGYTENLNDGRGITAGRAGFTTATGDVYEVVRQYHDLVADNILSTFLPVLKKLKARQSSSVQGLDEFAFAWKTASQDSRFRQIQDQVVDKIYYHAALEQAAVIGASQPLTLLVLYDTAIQHGDGKDKDSLPTLVRNTQKKMGGYPSDEISEEEWVREFLRCREIVLQRPHNKSSKTVWAESTGRVHALQSLVKKQNITLDRPLTINPWGTSFTLE